MAKKIVSLLLVTLMILSFFQGCTNKATDESNIVDVTTSVSVDNDIVNSFSELSDPALLDYMESEIYSDLIDNIDSEEYFVENIKLVYLSNEYIEELSFNSKENVYFGFTLSELEKQFQGETYVFTLSEDGKTIAKAFEPYDDTFDKIITNVATGTGVILVCVVLSAVTGGAGAPAVCSIFAVSAKTGTAAALSSGVFSGVTAGIATGIETQDFNEAIKAAALAGSEDFKWGAITGTISGGVGQTLSLRGMTLSGLSMNEAATIQKESKLPSDFIKQLKSFDEYSKYKTSGLSNGLSLDDAAKIFRESKLSLNILNSMHSVDEYNIYKNAALELTQVNGKSALVRNIDWGYTKDGVTNLQRVFEKGLVPLDETGVPYELHHIGQLDDSPLAILTKAEHRQNGNNTILHFREGESMVNHGYEWKKTVNEFYKALAKLQGAV